MAHFPLDDGATGESPKEKVEIPRSRVSGACLRRRNADVFPLISLVPVCLRMRRVRVRPTRPYLLRIRADSPHVCAPLAGGSSPARFYLPRVFRRFINGILNN